MSVLMVLEIPAKRDGMQAAVDQHGDLLKEVAGRSREHGAIHHAFYSDPDGNIMVVDEWPNAEAFQTFFDAESQNIGQLVQASGATGAPNPPRFYEKLAFGDDF